MTVRRKAMKLALPVAIAGAVLVRGASSMAQQNVAPGPGVEAPAADEVEPGAATEAPAADDMKPGATTEAPAADTAEDGADPEGGTETAGDDTIEEIEDVEYVEDANIVDPGAGYRGLNAPGIERGINVLLAQPTRARALLILIDHRAHESLFENAGLDFLGLDSGSLKIGLGLRYGILDDLDVGLYRLNNTVEIFDTYELDGRWRFLRQQDHQVDVALRAGMSCFVQPEVDDAVGVFGQLLVDRVFFDQLMLAAGFLFHSDSSDDRKRMQDDAYSGAVSAVIDWRFVDALSLNAEIAANVLGYGHRWPALSVAFEAVTARHTFALIFSNTQYVSADGIVTGAWRGLDEPLFGFQITREISL